MTEAFDGGQNLVCGLRPFEGLRVSVVQVDEGTDVGLELPDGGVWTPRWICGPARALRTITFVA